MLTSEQIQYYSSDRVVGERGGHPSNNGLNNGGFSTNNVGGFSTITEEKSPLVQLTKETIISLDYVSYFISEINIALVVK